MPDLRSLSTGTKLVLGGAILLLIDTFLPWQSFGGGELAGIDIPSANVNAWHGFWGVLLGLLTIAMIGWVGVQLLNVKLPELPVPARTITLGLGVLIFAFALIKNLADEESAWGSYVGVLLAAVVVAGAWMHSQEPEVVATSVVPTPPEAP